MAARGGGQVSDHPFPFLGAGHAPSSPLVTLLVRFAQPTGKDDRRSILARAPAADTRGGMRRRTASWDRAGLHLELVWQRPSTRGEDAAALSAQIETWLRRVHERAPIAFALLAEADGRSPWHAWSVTQLPGLLELFAPIARGQRRPTKLEASLLRRLIAAAVGAGCALPEALEAWSAPGQRELEALRRGDGEALRALLAARLPPPCSAALQRLLAELRERPDDRELVQVCADQLLLDGDERGELLVLSDRGAGPAAAKARLAELEERHGTRDAVLQALRDPVSAALAATLEVLGSFRPKSTASVKALLGAAELLLPCRLPTGLAEALVLASAQARADAKLLERVRRPEAERLRALADRVLTAARGWVAADPRRLGSRLGYRAYELARAGRFAEALLLFDALVDAEGLDLTIYNNATWAAQHDNNGLPLVASRHRRFLEACTPHGPRNPGIFFNAACLAFELDEHDLVLDYLRLALEHGYDKPHALRDEPLFAPLRKDPRFVALFANPPRARTEPEVTGGLWTPSKRTTSE
jgi:hypothetical protein